MPEHVHLLLWPTSPLFQVSAYLSTIKQSVSKRARLHLRRRDPIRLEKGFHFWQDGPGYDRNLIDERSIWHEIDYIHANPVRRGLCERPEDWRWSSAAQFCGLSTLDLLMDLSSLPPDLRTR